MLNTDKDKKDLIINSKGLILTPPDKNE